MGGVVYQGRDMLEKEREIQQPLIVHALGDEITIKEEIGRKSNRLLIVHGLLLLFTSVGNAIFLKKMTNSFPNYAYFLNQFTSFLYLPILWGIVLYEHLYTNLITNDMWKFPTVKFSVIGFLDAFVGLFTLLGGIHTKLLFLLQ